MSKIKDMKKKFLDPESQAMSMKTKEEPDKPMKESVAQLNNPGEKNKSAEKGAQAIEKSADRIKDGAVRMAGDSAKEAGKTAGKVGLDMATMNPGKAVADVGGGIKGVAKTVAKDAVKEAANGAKSITKEAAGTLKGELSGNVKKGQQLDMDR